MTADSNQTQERVALFLQFVRTMEHAGIEYVLLSGHRDLPRSIDSDIDFLVAKPDLARVQHLLATSDGMSEAVLVQEIRHEIDATYYVMAIHSSNGIFYLHPDVTADYRRGGRLLIRASDLLASRWRHAGGYWVPAPEAEFSYYLIKRLDKGDLGEAQLRRLRSMYCAAPVDCQAVIDQLWSDPRLHVRMRQLMEGKEIDMESLRLLRSSLRAGPRETWTERFLAACRRSARFVTRIIRPTGLVVAVLGPDGSGKSTVLSALERDLLPAFRAVTRHHLRPSGPLRKRKEHVVISNPHDQVPRSPLMSVVKAAVFYCEYVIGWALYVYPARVRSHLVLFDRCIDDLRVDHTRYRLGGAFGLISALCDLAPRPDVWIVLDAPGAQIAARKPELPVETLERLRAGYLDFCSKRGTAARIDTSCGVSDSAKAAVDHVLRRMHARTMQRVGHG